MKFCTACISHSFQRFFFWQTELEKTFFHYKITASSILLSRRTIFCEHFVTQREVLLGRQIYFYFLLPARFSTPLNHSPIAFLHSENPLFVFDPTKFFSSSHFLLTVSPIGPEKLFSLACASGPKKSHYYFRKGPPTLFVRIFFLFLSLLSF